MLQIAEKKFRYNVVSLQNLDVSSEGFPLREKVYRFWTEIWSGVFGAVGLSDALSPDEFFRQHLLACITSEDGDIVAMHLSTFLNLKSKCDSQHSYFSGVSEFELQQLKSQYGSRLMSIEYLTVNPAWRKSDKSIPWGDIVSALAMQVMQSAGCDAAVGTPRTDIGANRIGDRVGFVTFKEQIKKYDYSCSLMIRPRDASLALPDPKTKNLIETLWASRFDTSGIFEEVKRKAA